MAFNKYLFNIMTWLIIFYVVIIALFGLPYKNKKIIGDTSYIEAIEKEGFSMICYNVRGLAYNIGNILAITGCILIFSEDHIIKYCDYYQNKKYITNMIWFTIGIYALAIILQLAFLSISFVIMRKTQYAPLKEFARADFVWMIGITILMVYCIHCQFEWRSNLKSWEKNF